MDEIFAELSQNPNNLHSHLIDRFIACIKIAMGTPAQRGDVRAHARDALFAVICQFIERNLTSPSLSTATLLKQFGVSRASLYRMFDERGGVRNYITERRALRAMLDISKHPQRRGEYCSAAERWGFSSQPNFNRIIQRIYGERPSAIFLPRAGDGLGNNIGSPNYSNSELQSVV